MSRTYKDVPYHVREVKAMKAGFIKHDHVHLGKEVCRSVGYEVVTFEKSQVKEINAFEESLKILDPETVQYTKTELGNNFHYSLKNGDYSYYYSKKLVEFKVTYFKKYRYTSYCTDTEHYKDGFDTRDGGIAICTPDVYSYENRRFRCPCCSYGKPETSKAKRRAKFGQVIKNFNSGIDLEEIEDIVCDPDIELCYDAPTWGYMD